jgi:hypothetical protein
VLNRHHGHNILAKSPQFHIKRPLLGILLFCRIFCISLRLSLIYIQLNVIIYHKVRSDTSCNRPIHLDMYFQSMSPSKTDHCTKWMCNYQIFPLRLGINLHNLAPSSLTFFAEITCSQQNLIGRSNFFLFIL